jgi:hypothetical protein
VYRLCYILCCVLVLLARQAQSWTPWIQSTTFVSAAVQNGSSQAQRVSSASGLDVPKVKPINATAYDCWYFDAVSVDAKTAVVVAFYTAWSATVQALLNNTTVTWITLNVQFPNGTAYAATLPATTATIQTVGQGSVGLFQGSGFGWTGSPSLSQYVISVDAPSAGIKGTFELKSVGGPDTASTSL